MADLFGKLNNEVTEATYTGKTTSTAWVTVDNVNYTIAVDVNASSQEISDAIMAKIKTLDSPDEVKPREFVTSVSQVDGKIQRTRSTISQYDVINLVTDLQTIRDTKQDNLGFQELPGYPYDKETNKVVTNKWLEEEIRKATHQGMHFRGVFDDLSKVTDPKDGDVVIIINLPAITHTEYLYVNREGVAGWFSFGDEDSYIKHGQVDDSEVKANANIQQSKIKDLPGDLDTIRARVANRPTLDITHVDDHYIEFIYN